MPKLEKDNIRLSTSMDKEKILSSYEESKLKPLDSELRCSTTEWQRLYGEQDQSRSSKISSEGTSLFSLILKFCDW